MHHKLLFSHCSFCSLFSISLTLCRPLQHNCIIWDFKDTDESTVHSSTDNFLFCIFRTNCLSQFTATGAILFELKLPQRCFGDQLTLVSKCSFLHSAASRVLATLEDTATHSVKMMAKFFLQLSVNPYLKTCLRIYIV